MLADLTLDFMERLGQAKEEKNILDFSDLEHEALKVLTRRDEDGAVQPSKAALEYAELFREVMIDEYQDSNLVQELLLSSVSGGHGHPHNRFMVGDIKQSIYRFRLASPELFTEKYRTYEADGRHALKIDLHQNFRSREQVLGSVNYVFEKIMNRDLGGIDYDEKAALHPGAVFASERTARIPPCTIRSFFCCAWRRENGWSRRRDWPGGGFLSWPEMSWCGIRRQGIPSRPVPGYGNPSADGDRMGGDLFKSPDGNGNSLSHSFPERVF